MNVSDNTLPLFEAAGATPEAASAAGLSFEEAYAALEETVRQLERGDSAIDELVTLYERGVALAGLCNAKLDAAELRITQLRPTGDREYEETGFEG